MNRSVPTILATAFLTTGAWGQLVMPPREAPAPTPEYVPPPPRPERPAPKPVNASRPNIDQFKFEKLAKRDDDGNLNTLDDFIEIEAMHLNPLYMQMDEERKTAIEGAASQWREMVDRIVIGNLDLMQQLETGLIDQLQIDDREGVGQLTGLVKPLTLLEDKRRLVDFLKTEGLVDTQFEALNEKIGQEYRSEMREDYTNEAVKNAADDEHISIIARSFFHDMIKDTRDSFGFQILRLQKTGEAVIADMNLSAEEAAAIRSGLAAMRGATTTDAKIVAGKKMLGALSLEKQRELLTKSLETSKG